MSEEIKRMRYETGLFLTEAEFNVEQQYHMRMRRLHNRHLHTAGIIWGLDLVAHPGTYRVDLQPGMALDVSFDNDLAEELSREIVVPTEMTVDLTAASYAPNASIYLWIQYAEEEADTSVNAAGQPLHWLESFAVGHSLTKPEDVKKNVILGMVVLDGGGKVSSIALEDGNGPLRLYAGFMGKSVETDRLILSDDAISENFPCLNGTLFPSDGTPGIEVHSSRTRMTGELWIDHDLNVKEKVVTGGLEVSQSDITINVGEEGSGISAGKAGLIVERGTEPEARLFFDEQNDSWKCGVAGSESKIRLEGDTWDLLPVGFTTHWLGESPPTERWLVRDGSLLGRTAYAELFDRLAPAKSFTVSALWSETPVGSSPVALAMDGTYVWIANSGSNSVSRIRIADSTVTTIPVGVEPIAVTLDTTYVWVLNRGSATVTRILIQDPSQMATIPTGGTPSAMALDSDSLWVAGDGAVTRIRIATSETTSISLPPSPPSSGYPYLLGTSLYGIAVDSGAVWVRKRDLYAQGADPIYTTPENPRTLYYQTHETVDRIQIADGTLSSIPIVTLTGNLDPNASVILFDPVYAWVSAIQGTPPLSSEVASSLARIRISDGSVTLLPVGGSIRDIAIRSPDLWVVDGTHNVVKRWLRESSIVCDSPHGMKPGNRVRFETMGKLDGTGLSLNTDYYILAENFAPDRFEVSTAPGGVPVTIVDNGSGSHFVRNHSVLGPGNGSTTFSLPDDLGLLVRSSGTSSTQKMASGSYYSGGNVGDVLLDQFRGHKFQLGMSPNSLSNQPGYSSVSSQRIVQWYDQYISNPVTDGVNGIPRVGTETRGGKPFRPAHYQGIVR